MLNWLRSLARICQALVSLDENPTPQRSDRSARMTYPSHGK